MNARKKVLLLDDSVIDLRLLRMALNDLGDIDLIDFNDAHDALEYIRTHDVDLLIQDHIRPGLNGLELLKIIRSTDRTAQLKVFIVTLGIPDERDRIAYEDLDAEIFDKPVRHDPFALAVKDALSI